MKESTALPAGRLKKTLALVVLAGLMLTGCSGKQAATPTATTTATATAVSQTTETVVVPAVVNLTLDKAKDQLEKLGLKVAAVDAAKGKAIMVEKNWQVISLDPAIGAQVEKGSTVHLGVKNLDDVAAEKAAADKAAADKAAVDKAVADKVAADQAAAAKAAADQSARDAAARAAADQAAAAQKAAQAPAPAPGAYYANCTAAKNAGAAPLYRGQPGYRSALDKDNDGVACER